MKLWQRRRSQVERAWWAALGTLVCAVAALGQKDPPKNPPAAMEFKLDALGYKGSSAMKLAAGASVATVNFVDDTHLLLTFESHELVPRIEDDPREHEDRIVLAELVELPSGKVLATTRWRLHDAARYIWPLRNGRFLVRMGDALSLMDVAANLKTADPLLREHIGLRGGTPLKVDVSPSGDEFMVLTRLFKRPQTVLLGDEGSGEAKPNLVMDFFRATTPGGYRLKHAASMLSQHTFWLSADANGFLWADQQNSGEWSMVYDSFTAKAKPLGRVRSTCPPKMQMVGDGEFVVVSCRGADDRVKLTSYGLDGQETWEEPFTGFTNPAFAFAPSAGRFAIGFDTDVFGDTAAVANSGVAQKEEVRVYQTVSGDLLLRTYADPLEKTAENFDLSADGLMAAVLQGGSLKVYKLPELSARDRKDLAEVRKFAPAKAAGPMHFERLTGKSGVPDTEEEKPPSQHPANQAGSEAPEQPRKPPTLLSPGETPEGKQPPKPE